MGSTVSCSSPLLFGFAYFRMGRRTIFRISNWLLVVDGSLETQVQNKEALSTLYELISENHFEKKSKNQWRKSVWIVSVPILPRNSFQYYRDDDFPIICLVLWWLDCCQTLMEIEYACGVFLFPLMWSHHSPTRLGRLANTAARRRRRRRTEKKLRKKRLTKQIKNT